jgi:hypothetical protein
MQVRHVLFVAALATSTVAQARYVEIWNPPEARVAGEPAPRPRPKVTKRRHVSIHTSKATVRRNAAGVASARTPAAPSQAAPSFDDIPRQLTPDGYVLRVRASHAQVEVVQ